MRENRHPEVKVVGLNGSHLMYSRQSAAIDLRAYGV
jgi:hypothetical protein